MGAAVDRRSDGRTGAVMDVRKKKKKKKKKPQQEGGWGRSYITYCLRERRERARAREELPGEEEEVQSQKRVPGVLLLPPFEAADWGRSCVVLGFSGPQSGRLLLAVAARAACMAGWLLQVVGWSLQQAFGC